jgi:hypothetical protein
MRGKTLAAGAWLFGMASALSGLLDIGWVTFMRRVSPFERFQTAFGGSASWLTSPACGSWPLVSAFCYAGQPPSAAGLAILFRVLDIIAARLLARMLSVFSAPAVIHLILRYPHDHGARGAKIYNVAAIAAFWILACALASLRRDRSARVLHP